MTAPASGQAMVEPPAAAAARPRRGGRWMEWLLLIGVAVADQWTKALVRGAIPVHDSLVVIPGFLDLTHVRNTGAAFGFLNAVDIPFKPVVIAVIATAALAGIAVYASQLSRADWLARGSLGLILGGAVGNLTDRARFGYVVDFVDASWRDHHFWAFNVADSAITIGASLLILDMIMTRRHVSTTV